MSNSTLIPFDLPPHLQARVSILRDCPVDSHQAYVLYWMHHAMRDHDNLALDAAVLLGNRIGRPVLVYQGLGGNHPFNADRHHVFIMQGARDVQQGLEKRGIAYRYHLSAEPARPGPLSELARNAAIVITETFPAPPFPRWTRALGDRIDIPLWTLDCSCVVPMALVKRRFERAFQFRQHTRQAFDERLMRVWEDPSSETAMLPPGQRKDSYRPGMRPSQPWIPLENSAP